MRKATPQDIDRKAIVTTTDVFNGAEVLILEAKSDTVAIVKWANTKESEIKFNKLELC